MRVSGKHKRYAVRRSFSGQVTSTLLQVTPQNVGASDNGSSQRISGIVSEFDGEIYRWSQWKLEQYYSSGANPLIVDNVVEIGYPNPAISTLYSLINRFSFDRVPLLPFSGITMNIVPASLPDCNPDIVQIEYPWHFGYVETNRPDSTPLVYSSHNVEFRRIAAMGDSKLFSIVSSYTRRIERHAVESADLVLVTSKEDQDTYRSEFGSGTRIAVLPNGAEDVRWEPPCSDDGIDAVFVGSDYPPNIEAARYLVDLGDELPKDVNIHIVGTVGRTFNEDLPQGIHVHGFVDDVDDFLRGCDIALNPITAGGGSNVKVAKYLSHGLATVTTPFGGRGFELVHRENCLISSVDSFVSTLWSLVDDPSEVKRLGIAGRRLFESQYDWRVISGEHSRLMRELKSRT